MLWKFLKRHSIKQIFCLVLEEYLGFLFRYLPGYEGMYLRWLLGKITFKKIGKKILIWPNVFITHSYNINAGDFISINYGTHIDGRGGLELGNYVMIGPNVFIGSSNHIISDSDGEARFFGGHSPKPVKIGANVWIGANCVICPGVTIGKNVIIAAGSIVTKDFPDSVMVAGNPAILKKAL
jgi:maltose O-acetyltransferase